MADIFCSIKKGITKVLGTTLFHVRLCFLEYMEYRYPIVETVFKLIYIIALVLISGRIWGWYSNMSSAVLLLMTIGIFVVCVCLDTISILSEVKAINTLIERKGSPVHNEIAAERMKNNE